MMRAKAVMAMLLASACSRDGVLSWPEVAGARSLLLLIDGTDGPHVYASNVDESGRGNAPPLRFDAEREALYLAFSSRPLRDYGLSEGAVTVSAEGGALPETT